MANFDDQNFEVVAYENIPLHRDCLLMCEDQLEEFEQLWLDFFKKGDGPVDERFIVSWVAVEARLDEYLELNYCLDMFSRYHGIKRKLPKSSIVKVV